MKSKFITLTLVIPAYNETRHLKLCLDAISAQLVKADEVIVVDNNSTDETAEIANQYSFVKLVREKKQGIVYARNRGFNLSGSQIIGRIDADTILPSNWVGKVKSFYAHPYNENIAWTSAGYFYNIRFFKFNGWVQSQITFRFNRLLLGHYVLWGSTMAMTNKQWQDVQPYICKRNDIHEDLDLAIHLHSLGYAIHYDSGTNVAVYLKRVLSDRNKLWDYLQLWPQTLRAHRINTWVFSSVGALAIFILLPLILFNGNPSKFNEPKLLKR